MKGLRSGLVVLALLLPVALPAMAAQQSAPPNRDGGPPPGAGRAQVLDEIVVSGRRPSRNPSEILSWLRRLLGEFVIQGRVDPWGKSNPEDLLPVRGAGNCVPFGVAPAVHCDLQISWPDTVGPDGEAILGGVSTLVPAVMVLGFEADYLAVRYQLVDNTGLAEGGMDYLRDEALVTTTPCVGIAGKCERVMRIFASPDGALVRIQIEIVREDKPLVRYQFAMYRSREYSPEQSVESRLQ